ncbi:MAG: hypothetical protein IT249_14645 [Chitinophagaceae bacterium]|nr:hypothetical protein [Chitinophagaceae bacterium]
MTGLISKLNKVFKTDTYKKLLVTINEIRALPKLRINLSSGFAEGIKMYKYFTGRHPRYLIFKNKTIGLAIIDCSNYLDFSDYLQSVSGKNSAAYYARRCAKMGYTTKKIDPNLLQEQILDINLSAETRQGKKMADNYRVKLDYPINEFHYYWGVFKEEQLVSYCWIKKNGELRLMNRLLAHADHMNNGVMYKMLIDAIEYEFTQRKSKEEKLYIMYDTFFGAGEGLKLFKRRLGFKAFKVKWTLV